MVQDLHDHDVEYGGVLLLPAFLEVVALELAPRRGRKESMCLFLDGKKYRHDDSWSFGPHHFVGYASEDGSRVHMTKGKSEWLLKLQRERSTPEAIEAMKRHREILKEHGIEDLTVPFTVPDGLDLVRIPAK